MTEQVVLPIQRDTSILVFAYRQDAERRRRRFVAIAEADGNELRPIGPRLDDAARNACLQAVAWLREQGAGLTADLTRDAWISDLMGRLHQAPYPDQTPVETAALYLEYAKQRAMTLAMLETHRTHEPGLPSLSRLSAALLQRLLADHDLAAIAAVLDQDVPEVRSSDPTGKDGAYFFSSAALACQRLGRPQDRITCLRDACRCDETAPALRRLAAACFDAGDRQGAIDAYQRSAELAPLPDVAARRLTRLLADRG